MAFVYPNSRQALLAAGGPDSTLLGENHLADFGIDAFIHEPLLTRGGGGWLRWQLREVTLPLELRAADAVVTPLGRALPFAARAARGPAVIVLNYGFNVLLRHTTPLRKRIVRASLASARRVVCLAETQRRDLLELAGLDESHVATAALGIDADFFAPRPAAADGDSVLTVGKDLARDYPTFVAAVRGLPVAVRIAAMPRNLGALALPENVSVALLDPFELRSAYADAACVVVAQHGDDYPEGTEAGGLTALLEAMAMARPIVATDRAVVREYVTHGETALLVPPGDAAAMRAAVERVLGDRDLGARLGQAARARVVAGFTTRHLAERLAPLIREAVAR